MKKLFLAATILPLLSTFAVAADLPSIKGPPVYAPAMFSWAGVYIGGQIGYQWGRVDGGNYVDDDFTGRTPGNDPSGVVGGAHIGYNYQVSQFVFGLEGDVDGSSYRGSAIGSLGINQGRESIPVEGSIRGRVGYAWDRVLIYGTGGASFASIHSSVTSLVTGAEDSGTEGRAGWTVGGGIEYALDNNWSIRAEYRYTDHGTYSLPLINTSSSGHDIVRQHERDNAVRVGFSYKFDTFAPPSLVVAKY